MKNLLITGANGFVGKHLMDTLENHYNLYGTSREKKDGLMELNLLDDDAVKQFIDEAKGLEIQSVVHTASQLVNSEMNENEQMCVFENNVRMAFNLAMIIKELGITVLINCSSMAVYPNINGEFSENSLVDPSVNSEFFYGLSKYCSERIFDNLLKNICRIVHLRISQIYGEGLRSDRIIPKMRQAVKETNSIEVYGSGERISNFIDVGKVCETIGQMLAWDDARGIYNLGGKNLSYMSLAEKIKSKYGDENTSIILIEKGSKSKFILNTDRIEELRRSHLEEKNK